MFTRQGEFIDYCAKRAMSHSLSSILEEKGNAGIFMRF